LYRLSISAHRDRFVLKGGMLVTVWVADDNRVTRDADFLGHGDADPARLIADFGEIMAIESDDGLVFDINALADHIHALWSALRLAASLAPEFRPMASSFAVAPSICRPTPVKSVISPDTLQIVAKFGDGSGGS